MLIKVLVDRIFYTPVLEYYNSHKPDDEEPLKVLDRMEGGFMIEIPELKNNLNVGPNSKIQQVRWSRGTLSSLGFIGFSDNQTLLLYESLANALGHQNVILIKSG